MGHAERRSSCLRLAFRAKGVTKIGIGIRVLGMPDDSVAKSFDRTVKVVLRVDGGSLKWRRENKKSNTE